MTISRPHIAASAIVAAVFLVAVVGSEILGESRQAEAATFTVTKTADTNDGTCDADCSLREAIGAANAAGGADIVSVPAGTYTLTLAGFDEDANATGDLDITTDVTINGAGAATTIIDGNATDRVIDVKFNATVEISGVTIQNGANPECTPQGGCGGGGIINSFGFITITDSVVKDNISDFGGGGIISYGGTVAVTDSTISGNTAATDGGGFWNHGSGNGAAAVFTVTRSTVSGNTATGGRGGGIIHTFGSTVNVTNSTISGNTADALGGAVHSNDGSLSLANATVTGNTSLTDTSGGLFNLGTVTLTNTLVADQVTGTDCVEGFGGTFESNGHNLDSDNSCGLTDPDDLPNSNAMLGPLQDNGGPTLTHALLAGSPAIDAGDGAACPATDQRGVARPQGVQCDIGAYETAGAGTATPAPTASPSPTPTASPSPTPTASPSPTPTATASPTATPAQTPTPTAAPFLDVIRDLQAEAIDRDAIVITWTDTSVGEDGFEVRRSTEGGPFTTIALLPPSSSGMGDAPLTSDTTYTYQVRAFRGGAFADWSNPATATTFPDLVPPTITFPWILVNSAADTSIRDGVMTLREAMGLATGDLAVVDLDIGECAQLLNWVSFNGTCTTNRPFGAAWPDLIVFDPAVFPPDNPTTIAIGSALPDLSTGNDGISASEGVFDAGVTVEGLSNFSCLAIVGETSDNNSIQGLQITGCFAGVFIGDGADDNLIGGTTPDERNVIYGNQYGARIYGSEATGNEIYGNHIGTNATGVTSLPNEVGVHIYSAQDNKVGGINPGEGNLISGNREHGVKLEFADGNLVQGNLIGTDAGGLAALPNGMDGVVLEGSDGSTIGPGNVISGNVDDGLYIFDGTGNVAAGNFIGTDVTGAAPLGNGDRGVVFQEAFSNTLGTPSSGNVIAYNGTEGVWMRDSRSRVNSVRGNSIHSNGARGINIPGQLGPGLSISQAIGATGGGALFVAGELAGGGNFVTYNLDFYANTECDPSGAGEGERYLDSVAVVTPTGGEETFEAVISDAVSGGDYITATATSGSRGTTEFTQCFQVTEQSPVAAGELNVRCTHSPIWPTSADTITITAEALDPALVPVLGSEEVEVWVDGAMAASRSDWHVVEHTIGPFSDGTFSYACLVKEGTGTAFSRWRTVTVGFPESGSGIPVSYGGPPNQKIDVVFVADVDSYPAGSQDVDFLEDVETAILDGYFNEPLFLKNQSKFNFWIAGDPGRAKPTDVYDATLSEDFAGDDSCGDGMDNGGDGFTDADDSSCIRKSKCPRLDAPGGWMDDLAFAEVGAILHTDEFRDCASPNKRLFSAWTGILAAVIRHETGHAPFRLADEYCCDGGYFEKAIHPNLYNTLSDCEADAGTVIGRSASDCRQLSKGVNTVNWWTSDPASNDLMVDIGVPELLDLRRIEWMLDMCDKAMC